jgi:hypothetical protein
VPSTIGPNFSLLKVSGSAKLGGKLMIDHLSEYPPFPGSYPVLTATSISGEFATRSLLIKTEHGTETLGVRKTATGVYLDTVKKP